MYAGREAAEQDSGDGTGGQRGRAGRDIEPGDDRALRPARQQAGGGQGRDQRRVYLAGSGCSAAWTRASERDSSMQPAAIARTATISTTSSQPLVCTFSPNTVTP